MTGARERAKEAVRPFLPYGAHKFDALLESAIEEQLLAYGAECRRKAFEDAAKAFEGGTITSYSYGFEFKTDAAIISRLIRALADTDKQDKPNG